uniref:Uncharacterized protein n=1 Tax=Moniliophthora roreri TaxID=221103 RepID=A0A0W0FE59_MONRR
MVQKHYVISWLSRQRDSKSISSSTINLQLKAVAHSDTSLWMTSLPAASIFKAMYDLKIPVSWPIAALGNDNHLDLNFKPEPENSKKRKITAAVLIPLLFIAAGILAYMKWQRKRTADKRKNFAQQVNKHMLTISVGWKSMSDLGLEDFSSHAIRAADWDYCLCHQPIQLLDLLRGWFMVGRTDPAGWSFIPALQPIDKIRETGVVPCSKDKVGPINKEALYASMPTLPMPIHTHALTTESDNSMLFTTSPMTPLFPSANPFTLTSATVANFPYMPMSLDDMLYVYAERQKQSQVSVLGMMGRVTSPDGMLCAYVERQKAPGIERVKSSPVGRLLISGAMSPNRGAYGVKGA